MLTLLSGRKNSNIKRLGKLIATKTSELSELKAELEMCLQLSRNLEQETDVEPCQSEDQPGPAAGIKRSRNLDLAL